jgi:hypothetical protein
MSTTKGDVIAWNETDLPEYRSMLRPRYDGLGGLRSFPSSAVRPSNYRPTAIADCQLHAVWQSPLRPFRYQLRLCQKHS